MRCEPNFQNFFEDLSYEGKTCICQQVVQFHLMRFMESFSIIWTALLILVFCITFNFSIAQTFTTVVRIFSNLHFLILSGVWLLDFKCFEILCRLMVSLAYFPGMLTSLFGRMTSKDWVNSDSPRRCSLKDLSFVP